MYILINAEHSLLYECKYSFMYSVNEYLLRVNYTPAMDSFMAITFFCDMQIINAI